MIFAVFDENDRYKVASGLWQYAFGQSIAIQGLKLPPVVSVDFSLNKTGLNSEPRIGVTKDGITEVPIPDSFLINGNTTSDYTVYVFISIINDKTGNTEYRIDLPIKSRPKPKTDNKNPEDAQIFREAMKVVNESAVNARESEKQAKLSADNAREDAVKTDADRKAVEELVKQTSNIDAQVEEVKQNAQKAVESAQNAKASETNASMSEANAKQSETNAKTSETNAKKSEQAVEQAKTSVDKSKQAVDETVARFNQSATEASQALKNEKEAHLKAITSAGTSGTKKVTDEGTKQVKAVQDTGTAETGKVTSEGTKQVGAVKTEAEKHLQTITDATNGIVADRQQIGQNKADVTQLKEALTKLVIEDKSSGNPCVIFDSADWQMQGLNIYGQSEQNGTPTPDAPVPIISKEVSEIKVSGKNLIDVPNQFDSSGWFAKDITNIIKPNTKYYVKADVKNKTLPSDEIVSVRIDYTVGGSVNYIFGNNTLNGLLEVTFELSAFDNVKLVFKTKRESSGLTDLTNIMISVIDSAYEPYKEPQVVTLSKPITLRGILTKNYGNLTIDGKQYISDVITERDGVIGVERNINQIIVDGSDLKFTIVGDNDAYWNLPHRTAPNVRNVVSNYSNYLPKNTFASNTLYEFLFVEKETIQNYFTDINKFNEFIVQKNVEGKPLEIYYVIKTTFEPLPEPDQQAIKTLKSYYPNTVIQTGCWNECEYVADPKLYIEKQHQGIQSQIHELQANLITAKISGQITR